MTTSIVTFRNEFTEGVLNFIWRQWCRMGVVGSVGQRDPWVIDPEPVLAFTTEVARHDARMFDEVLDWLVRNGYWINTQRLSTMMKQDNVGDKAVLGAIGMPPGQRAVSHGTAETQPMRANRPSPAAMAEQMQISRI